MNISMNVECTPEEARRLMGLPDLQPIHDAYLEKLKDVMTQGVTPEGLDSMLRTWSPMGEAGLNVWKQLIDQVSRASRP